MLREILESMKDLDPSLVEKVISAINKDFGKTNKLVRKDDPIWHDTDDLKEIFINVPKPPRGWFNKLPEVLAKAGMKEEMLNTYYQELEFINDNFSLSASKRGKTIEMVIQRRL